MATRSFDLKIDAREVRSLADRLDASVSGAALGRANRDAVNEVTLRAHESTTRGMTADIGLTPTYVRSKTDVSLATDIINPVGEIVTRGDLTILGRYPITQLRKPAVRASDTGPTRGRPSGVKAAIRRSAPVTVDKWFTMRLRAGGQPGDNTGVFVRATGRAKPKHIYGPSPYSLFRHQVGLQESDIADDLQRTALEKIVDSVERTLT